ncbi:ead/Ea22-like family protein [Salmonella enterica subsp. enterica serovar Cerro]|nr:ead/Ea22-like family protein [Salmonella enterica subsp. enterica serovar Cerro]EFJ5969006.1 ead/Ea22-like family protein [Escherichia coli]EBH9149831.1 ead/Ea22-like family protein [Salmonella enterica subsp. enterica serovar Cerro]EBH9156525.1 ead/Ea22-like family protein [Salmonella enterica subsp. enterica serovar Cerro]EBH9499257.1 ead/Ea22-like family protein [Salmonella enterica subsp. enterica serovar Cerro]
MSEINYQALREAAERAIPAMERLLMLPADDDLLSEQELKDYGVDIDALNAFKFLAGPETVLALLDERERNQQYIKSRDHENEDIALTVGKMLIENGRLVADTLRHLADNEIDSDYFAITSTNENGTEIDHEMAITDYALQAAGTVDELVAALESAENRIAELSASHSKLRDTMAGIHNTIRMDGGYTPLAAILNAAKRAYEESASAAGIRIKGE